MEWANEAQQHSIAEMIGLEHSAERTELQGMEEEERAMRAAQDATGAAE